VKVSASLPFILDSLHNQFEAQRALLIRLQRKRWQINSASAAA